MLNLARPLGMQFYREVKMRRHLFDALTMIAKDAHATKVMAVKAILLVLHIPLVILSNTWLGEVQSLDEAIERYARKRDARLQKRQASQHTPSGKTNKKTRRSTYDLIPGKTFEQALDQILHVIYQHRLRITKAAKDKHTTEEKLLEAAYEQVADVIHYPPAKAKEEPSSRISQRPDDNHQAFGEELTMLKRMDVARQKEEQLE